MELINALQELHSGLTNPHPSQAETAKLEQSLKMLVKWHNELKDLDKLASSWSQDYRPKLQYIEKLGEDYKRWRETGITSLFFMESFGARLFSASLRLSSIWKAARDLWESVETPTSSNPERSETRRRFRRSQPPSGWRDLF